MPRKHPRIKFDLLANASDSLRQAVELLAWQESGSDHSRLKHAVTNCAHCVELLLKERLRRIHPAFVWEHVEKYPSLDAKTVTVETAIARVKTIASVALTDDDEKMLKSLRRTRNGIEHYEWDTTEKEAKVIIGSALSFALAFAKDELHVDLAQPFQRDDTWKQLLDELWEFHNAHMGRLEAKLKSQGAFAMPCDECGAETVTQSGSCELCGHWQDIDA